MGFTEKGRFESRITAPWCGSRVAGWRVAAGTTTVLLGVLSLLTSEASLVSLAWIWNEMVPRLETTTTLRKLDIKVTPVTVVPVWAVLLKQVTVKASKTPEDSVTSMASMVASTKMVASMESKETPMASMASVAPMAMMALASLALVGSMVWVTDLGMRTLRNEMLKFSPLKTWICSSMKQAWDAEGSRRSRWVDVANVEKELMASQIWSVVVTWAMMASMASMVASMASLTSTVLMALGGFDGVEGGSDGFVGLGDTNDVDGVNTTP